MHAVRLMAPQVGLHQGVGRQPRVLGSGIPART